MRTKAFLFDLNGTMIDDMLFHLDAWYEVVKKLGSPISKQAMKSEMYGKNEEVLNRIFGQDFFSDEQMKAIGMEKEVLYQQAFKPHIKLIPGLENILHTAHAKGIKMAIGSAAIPFNINFVIKELRLEKYFSAIVSADDVAISKPHPEVFLKCANALNVNPDDCIVFEDAPKGVESAQRAGMNAVAITTLHDEADFDNYNNVLLTIKDYSDKRLLELLNF